MTAIPRLAFAAGPDPLEPAAIQADVAWLGRAYQTLHPGLLRYQTETEFQAHLDVLTSTCARPTVA